MRNAILILIILTVGFLLLKVNEKNNISKNMRIEEYEADQENEQVDGLEMEKEVILQEVFTDTFNGNEPIEETGKMNISKNSDWWVNSGAFLVQENSVGKTLQGELEAESKWHKLYRKNNARDTDNGYHPQNIFRLVTRNKWLNFNQQTYFRITKNNLSKSKYRNASNGLLLFNRYQDGDNLYYTGIRVDGVVVIKKKCKGKYHTMAYEKIFEGKYNCKKNPNLLPQKKWIGVKSEVKTVNQNEVEIKVFIDEERNGNWKLILEARDDGKSFGGKSILNEGFGGIRTDFMDVEFDDYKIKEI